MTGIELVLLATSSSIFKYFFSSNLLDLERSVVDTDSLSRRTMRALSIKILDGVEKMLPAR